MNVVLGVATSFTSFRTAVKGVYNVPSLMKFRIVTENRDRWCKPSGSMIQFIIFCTRGKDESEFVATLHSHGDRVVDNCRTTVISLKWLLKLYAALRKCPDRATWTTTLEFFCHFYFQKQLPESRCVAFHLVTRNNTSGIITTASL